MKSLLVAVVLVGAACTRQVRVETTPSVAVAPATLKVNNTTSQAVVVSVEFGGTEFTLKSVAANSTELLSIPGVPLGSTVKLRAKAADGSRAFAREGVVLAAGFEWRVP